MSLNSCAQNENENAVSAPRFPPQDLGDEEMYEEEIDVAELDPVDEAFGSVETLKITNRRLPLPQTRIDLTREWSPQEWLDFHE